MSEAVAVHHGDFGRACIYNLNKQILMHAHREAHLIFKIDGVDSTIGVDGKKVELTRSTAVSVSPWQPHCFDLGDGGENCVTLVLYIKPIWFLENSDSEQHALSFGSNALQLDERASSRIARLAHSLLSDEVYERNDDLLYELMSLCFQQSWSDKEEMGFLDYSHRRFTDFRVRRAVRLMQENISEELNLARLARECGISRPHFFKLFKKQMGLTPNLYLNTLRAERAIDELMTTEKTVTDIGNDLGFSSQASFTRFFTSNVGIPPSDYRRVAHVA